VQVDSTAEPLEPDAGDAFRADRSPGPAGRVQHETHRADSLAESLAAYVRDAELIQHVYRLAERQGRLPRGSLVARELVTDVIEDMFMGVAKCNLERKIAPQVEREVLRRANRLRKANRSRSKRRDAPRPEFIPLDKAPPRTLLVDPFQEALEALDDDSARAPDDAELVSRIREYACEDEAVQQLLVLYDRDIVLRRDVVRCGMTLGVYRAARERLARYAEIALLAASTSTPAVQPPDSEDVQDAALPATLARDSSGRTARVRRAARRQRDRVRRLRSA